MFPLHMVGSHPGEVQKSDDWPCIGLKTQVPPKCGFPVGLLLGGNVPSEGSREGGAGTLSRRV